MWFLRLTKHWTKTTYNNIPFKKFLPLAGDDFFCFPPSLTCSSCFSFNSVWSSKLSPFLSILRHIPSDRWLWFNKIKNFLENLQFLSIIMLFSRKFSRVQPYYVRYSSCCPVRLNILILNDHEREIFSLIRKFNVSKLTVCSSLIKCSFYGIRLYDEK